MKPGRIAAVLRWLSGAVIAAACLAGPDASAEDTKKDDTKKASYIAPKPTEASQTQKTVDERGGTNPCNTPEPKPGVYEGWNRAPSMGQMMMPARGGVTKDGRFDVVIHFHGHDPARKEFVRVMDGAVLVGITLGIGSGAYSSSFSSPNAFKDLIESVEAEVAKQRGLKSAKVRKIALSAWSAGYGAVEQILRQERGKEVDSVILLDGLHVGYNPDGTLQRAGLEPFIDFAKRAKAGKRFMFVSHSSIIPPGYASTTETVNYLVHELGGKEKKAKPRASDPLGLEMNAKFDVGNFHARGFDGNDKMDHCAHIGLLRDVLKSHIKPRWKSPKGQAAKKDKDKSPSKDKSIAKAESKKDKPKEGTSKSKKKKSANSKQNGATAKR
ncbi:MAG: hypothetical protein HOW73_14290 [Polyangiaceae bacterium]|nr:hypothetical protein [Polyangiaceae bacterium]